MNKFICLFVLLNFSLFLYSQERTIKISVHSGFFQAGDYQNIQPGNNYGIDVSYYLSNRFFLTAHFNYGSNKYYEDSGLTTKSDQSLEYQDATNATKVMNNVGLLAGYYLPVTQWGNLTGQIGFAQIIEIAKAFPVKTYQPDPNIDDRVWHDFTFFSATFPVKFSAGITPFKQLNIGFAKNIEIGYAFGFYMSPDLGLFTGIYHGPQLSISF